MIKRCCTLLHLVDSSGYTLLLDLVGITDYEFE